MWEIQGEAVIREQIRDISKRKLQTKRKCIEMFPTEIRKAQAE